MPAASPRTAACGALPLPDREACVRPRSATGCPRPAAGEAPPRSASGGRRRAARRRSAAVPYPPQSTCPEQELTGLVDLLQPVDGRGEVGFGPLWLPHG